MHLRIREVELKTRREEKGKNTILTLILFFVLEAAFRVFFRGFLQL